MNQTAQYRGTGSISHQLHPNQTQHLQTGFVSRFPTTNLDNLNSVMIPTISSHQEHIHYQIMPPVTNSRNKIMVDVSTMTDPEEDEQNGANWQNVNVPSNTKVAEYLSSLRQFLKDADGSKFRMDVTGSGTLGGSSVLGSVSGVGNTVGLVSNVKATNRRAKERDPNDIEHRPYGCAQCGKAFKRNEHLARHIVTHSGLKPHACIHCGKAFYRKDHLIKHTQSHNQPPKPKLPSLP